MVIQNISASFSKLFPNYVPPSPFASKSGGVMTPPSSYGSAAPGVGLAGCRFLCAGKYLALLIEHECSGPLHPAPGGVMFPGILFMTWRAQGVMNSWLLVFLYRMCCHEASCAVVQLVAFQGVRLKPCMLSPFGGNF